MPEEKELITHPIPKLITRIAVPASVGFFFNTMFNVVDTYFGGLISTEVLAALSLSLSVYFIIIAMGTGISTGTTALIANALGAGNRQQARLFATQGITFGILTAIVLTFLGIYLSPYLFAILGATDRYLVTSILYMNTIFTGTVFFLLAYMLNAILNALGDTRSFRNFLITGFFLNIIFDPWFIYGGVGLPALGIVGIGLATVVIQCLGCLYLGFKVYRTGVIVGKELREIFPMLRPFKEIARQGLPASINMITVGIGFFVITYFASKFGKEAVAAYGIGIRVEQMILIPTVGLNIATLTLAAQNNGAGLFARVRETLTTALRYGGIIMAAGTVIIFVLAPYFMALFTDDETVITIGITYLRIDSLVFYAYVILFTSIAAMQGIKKPMFAIWIGFARQLVAPLIVFTILIDILHCGLLGIWWGFFSITWGAAVFTIVYVLHHLKGLINAES